MPDFEFKIVPAPRRSLLSALFPRDPSAMTLAEAVNALADQGWTFQRKDVLPLSARSPFTFAWKPRREVLVFRRPARRSPPRPENTRPPAEDPQVFARDMDDLLEGLPPLEAARAA